MADGELGQVKISRILIKAFFPALLLGLAGLIVFGLFGALFGMINSTVTSSYIPKFFASFGTMAFLGFVIGFGAYLGYKFEEVV